MDISRKPPLLTRVAAGIIIQGGRVLVTRRGPMENLAGCWEFPGGKLEPQESPEECVVRELREELSLTACAKEIIATSTYQYPKGTIELIAIKCEVEDMNMSLTVHDEFQLLEPKALLDINLAPADIEIAKKLGELYG